MSNGMAHASHCQVLYIHLPFLVPIFANRRQQSLPSVLPALLPAPVPPKGAKCQVEGSLGAHQGEYQHEPHTLGECADGGVVDTVQHQW